MAGDWIPWNHGLSRKREIMLIARELRVDRRKAAALCMEVWEWADVETVDGFMRGMTFADVDAAVGVRGMATAMGNAGWLVARDNGLFFPNWDRWNSKSAKARLLETRRKQSYRASLSRDERDNDGTDA